MARASRAPSPNAYRGAVGRTQTAVVHVSAPSGELIAATVHVTIDAVADPELAQRLKETDPARALNVVRVEGGEPIRVAVPVVYHDPAAEVLALVLGEPQRHRELDERIRLLERLRDDAAPVPAYAKDFAVVFGAAGLEAYLEKRAREAIDRVTTSTGELRVAQLPQPSEPRPRARPATAPQPAAPAPAPAPAPVPVPVPAPSNDDSLTAIGPPPSPTEESSTKKVPRAEAVELAASGNGVRAAAAIPHVPVAAPAPAPAPAASPPASHTEPIELDEEPTGLGGVPRAQPRAESAPIVPSGADPLTTETQELPLGKGDPWLEFAATGAASSFQVREGLARMALLAGENLSRGFGGALDLRVLLHRAPTYPIVVLVIGPPAALRVPSPTQIAVVPLDVGTDLDRQVLAALSRTFELVIDVVLRGKPIRRARLVAPLAENVAYVLRAADDHLRGITSDGEAEPSYARARDLVLGPGYDLLGLSHTETGEFRDDKLAQIHTAQQLRRAIAIARRFARPSREDYLVCARGFPLVRWRELRRHVLEAAVAWGLWMGPELAQVAVSEGLARSRRDLIVKLDAGFESLRRHPTAFDIDTDAAEDNAKAIAEEARALGVELRRGGAGAIKSEDVSTVSGSIDESGGASGDQARRSIEELIALLDDKQQRVAAALELCERGEARGAAPVIAAIKKMSRAEAVRVLGKSVRFGAAAAAPLQEGLQSSKAFLRHGCALALALLRTEQGTHAVIDLLLDEPTEIWREVARAVGQIGPTALMPLSSRVNSIHAGGDVPANLQERIAWAAAHVGVRGGKVALDQLAAGQSVMAPIARQALSLLDSASRDEVRLVPSSANKDVTVNRAFSRRFFEALESEQPDVARAALAHDGSMPMETLDESDLLEEEEAEAELDESDLIHP